MNYTILYNGAPWLSTQIQTYNGGINRPGGTTTQTQTGYYTRKFMGNFENTTSYEDHYRDWIYFRYAEVLLNYAEAQNEYGGPSDAIFTAVESVRQRAKLNPYAWIIVFRKIHCVPLSVVKDVKNLPLKNSAFGISGDGKLQVKFITTDCTASASQKLQPAFCTM